MIIEQRLEKMILSEIRNFPKSELFKLFELIKFLRLEFFENGKPQKTKKNQNDFKKLMGSFRGKLSSTQEFSRRKVEEKGFEK